MLNKFNNLIRNILLESEESKDSKKAVELYHSNEFYNKYIKDLADECEVVASKQRENAFLLYASLGKIKSFFTKFKVDEEFMENPSEFVIHSPIFTYGDVEHNLKLDEAYATYSRPDGAIHTHDLDNVTRTVVHGKWFPLVDDSGKNIKTIKPIDVTKYFRGFYPRAKKDFNDDVYIYIEFQVNCEKWANQIYDEMSEYARDPDEMNDAHNEDPDDFDYTVLNVKNVDDESVVKNALKDVKRTDKDYKSVADVKKVKK